MKRRARRVGGPRHRRVEQRVLQRRPHHVAVVPDRERRRAAARAHTTAAPTDSARAGSSGPPRRGAAPPRNAGATCTEPAAPIVPTRVTCTPSITSSIVSRAALATSTWLSTRPRLDLAQRLDDALHAAAMRRIELADVQHAHQRLAGDGSAAGPPGDRAIQRGDHAPRVARPAELGSARDGPRSRRASQAVGSVLALVAAARGSPSTQPSIAATAQKVTASPPTSRSTGMSLADHRRAARQRLDDRQAEAFAIRRQQRQRAAPVDRARASRDRRTAAR